MSKTTTNEPLSKSEILTAIADAVGEEEAVRVRSVKAVKDAVK
jgi:hypothetical protein